MECCSGVDGLLFRHAAKCGAKVFDGAKVNSIEFSSISLVAHQAPTPGPCFPVAQYLHPIIEKSTASLELLSLIILSMPVDVLGY